jgi:hypothetical protein
MLREDYIIRLIKQLADAIARANELYLEARRRDPRDDDDSAILELSRE